MRKRTHVREYYRRKHGLSEHGGEVSEHNRGYEAGKGIQSASKTAKLDVWDKYKDRPASELPEIRKEAAAIRKTEQKEDLDLKSLNQYYGTEQYHNVMGSNVTDGVKYVMDNGYSWFVTDSLIAMRMIPELKEQEFLAVQLKLPQPGKAVMEITDGDERVLYTQKYDFTDAKREFKMFYVNNVLMLSGEY